ncbi:MAG: hypothetical protein AUK63_2486 [bacterium P3]|nr:MAG: hypothetical protein AUK63_2486 [bacterium P3]
MDTEWRGIVEEADCKGNEIDMDNQSLIEGALSQAGQPTTVTPELQKLDETRIASDTYAPEEEFLFKIFGTPCFPRGDLTTVTGPAKSGKTFFLSMLMACAVRRQVLGLERIREEPLRVLWYDTEQSRYTTKRILTGRIGALLKDAGGEAETFPDGQYYVFNMRDKLPRERVDYLELAIKTYRPDICIIDGIADMLEDINSGPDSVRLMQQFQMLATTYGCNITMVIHLNRTGEKLNLRGWLGTLMLHKSYEVFNCDRLSREEAFTAELTVSRHFSRKETLCYAVCDDGLPVQSDASRRTGDGQGREDDRQKAVNNSFNQEFIDGDAPDPHLPWDFRKLFTAAFGPAAMLGADDLKRQVKELGNIRMEQYYDKVFAEAERQRIVRTELTNAGRVGVILLPPS